MFVASQNNITEKGALAFACALMAGIGLPALRKLKLGRLKKMGETGLVTLAAGLTQCHQLEEWDMDSEYESKYNVYTGEYDRPLHIMESIGAILGMSRSEEEKIKIVW